ncbi:hypothetical protein [Pedobacter alluvionis]|uniref:Fibronectin type-III domain-containing protein n=1 Tax=Pedobacter alluvionis TaxID=475253 RepID=A0A497Y176_9SPHI|nr:hypothetical protein [Pedobacter alluvionis]RLJ76623.1 hypothetical protein BCL90_1666 [Pedobacter alluvionis]TFB34097.1 hypothetical protein E3V97_08655 [Pedobacter alluvionis]
MKTQSKKHLIVACLMFAMFGGCKKGENAPETSGTKTEANAQVASLTTTAFTNITTTGAMSGGIITDKGSSAVTDQGICWSTSPKPTIEGKKVGVVSINGAGVFASQLTGLAASTKYYVRAFVVNKAGIAYGNEIELTTASIASATFGFSPMYIIGSTVAAADIEVLTDGGDAVTERGIVYASSPNPTISNSKVKHNNAGLGKFRVSLKDLSPKTTYYARAYAINAKGTSYSNDVTFKTIAKGNFTYTFNKSQNPGAEELAAYGRLQVAIDSAVWYFNNYTSVTKHVYLNYVDGVPTADANNQGWMRFGTNSSYQNLRTMLHEVSHTLGTGTSSWWSSTLVNGKLQAPSVTAILRLITNDNTAQISGDSQHYWPYGLNQNSEVTSSWDFTYTCLIIEAMRKDGLTQFSGAYTP